ncbi:4-carboxymuconolactone decarboxylase [Micractinium conductrix]|uniref:4-carboxymuconolactone decarboxylase n=1 Tax=Micractinium conductrix TaxID=554055 RepID=A0A2P6VFH5_9CHLO|nr:4-carboxymuconolactone decarboxylase [Micractinium conductrix]|eukprot:PSC72828.1 4-carboxymuconolactone decarboxylase [Micractinium conductrix]
MDLSGLDRALTRLYMAGCLHFWEQLPGLARDVVAEGGSLEELRGCVRHLVVFAGYGPCLAATLALHKAGLLPENTPAKAGGPPGDAFELVYTNVTDRVRAKMHDADPILGEWIRMHLYGDIYSSPGLDMRRKQLLTCAFLAEAAMPDQLFGHALAALRFGNSVAALEEVARLACDLGTRPADKRRAVLDGALRTLDMAYAKFQKDMAGQLPHCPEPHIPDPTSVRVPPLPPLFNTPAAQQPAGQQADAVVDVAPRAAGGLKAATPAKAGWGTSSICRPTNLAVDVIAARMEEQRARSGLFFGLGFQEEEELAGMDDAGEQ